MQNSMKNLGPSFYFVTLFDFLSLKNDVNVASKSNKQKVNDENSRIRIQDPDPDPLVRGMDPRIQIRIHPKMSWIRNTGCSSYSFVRLSPIFLKRSYSSFSNIATHLRTVFSI
jgi:hypothetical protein